MAKTKGATNGASKVANTNKGTRTTTTRKASTSNTKARPSVHKSVERVRRPRKTSDRGASKSSSRADDFSTFTITPTAKPVPAPKALKNVEADLTPSKVDWLFMGTVILGILLIGFLIGRVA